MDIVSQILPLVADFISTHPDSAHIRMWASQEIERIKRAVDREIITEKNGSLKVLDLWSDIIRKYGNESSPVMREVSALKNKIQGEQP